MSRQRAPHTRSLSEPLRRQHSQLFSPYLIPLKFSKMAESTNPSSEAPNPLQAIIDTTSKLRQGFAPLPRVRDKQEHAPEITKEFDHIATKFLEIFSETRMDWHFVDIARQFFDGHPQVRSKAYIRVFAPWRPNDDAWHNALKRFEEKYIITGIVALTEVGLEIQDPSKREWISSIPEHHSIFERWKSLQEEALVLLEGSEWSVLTACRYGPSPESQRDPIIIYLGVENPYLFEEIGWKLIKMCRKFNLEDVSVRVLETSIWTSLGSDSDPVEVDLEAVNTLNTIRMGSSLNAGNRKESGTFGGLVKLKSSDGTSEAFGVTNFHVVWDCEKKSKIMNFFIPKSWLISDLEVKNKETGEETEVEPTGIDAEFQNYGIDPERIYPEFKDGIPLYSPSDTGTQRVLHSWNRSIEQWESELVDRIRMVEEERGGIWRDRDETFKREREKNIQTFRDKIQKLENSERRIGSVYAASGNRFQESGLSYILDWTLIKLNPDKDFNNIVSIGISRIGKMSLTASRYLLLHKWEGLGIIPSQNGFPRSQHRKLSEDNCYRYSKRAERQA